MKRQLILSSFLLLALTGGAYPEDDGEQGCICNKVTLRFPTKEIGGGDQQDALGPKGDGSEPWPPKPSYEGVTDGKTVGPLAKNKGSIGINKKNNIGYGFEVKFDVTGIPKSCREIQVVKATSYRNDKKTQDKQWTGKTADLDLSGTASIDVSTEDKCKAEKGEWDGTNSKCTLKFPVDGKKYGPDVQEDNGAGGAYQEPFEYKKHLDKAIIWFDVPSYPRGVVVQKVADFISIVRGTDKKYCYVKFKVSLKSGAKPKDPDTEQLDVSDAKVDADKVPDVP